MRALHLCVLLALSACGTEPDPVSAPPVAPPELITSPEAPFVSPPDEEAGDGVDIALLISSANEAITLAASIAPDPILAAYRDLATGAEPACPAIYSDGTVDYWLDSCTTSSGTLFEGFGVDAAVSIDDGYSSYDVESTGGTARIEDASGIWLELDGFVQRIDDEDEGVVSSTLILAGRFDTNHPAADGSWLEEGLRPNLVTSTYDIGSLRAAFFITGAVDELQGAYSAVAFDSCGVIDASIGYGGCDLEPSGVVSLRMPTGGWIDIVFDPIAVDEGIVLEDPATCDGCGRVWDGDVDLGTVCLDFSAWLQ